MKRIFRLLAVASLLVPAVGLAAGHAVILQYHHVDTGTPAATSVTPAQFQEHLDWLAANDFQVLPLDRIVADLHAGRELPENAVAITIDDAYDSVYEQAWPRLREKNWPFTVFVNTDATDTGKGAYLTWAQMREMSRAGVVFANHSATHEHLVRRRAGETEDQWRDRVGADIDRAQRRLQEELGRAPKLFAYPYGEFDTALKALLRARGYIGFGQQSGPAWEGSDFLALPRFAMAAGYARMASFTLKVRTLPLPVEETSHPDPVLEISEWSPTLKLRIAKGLWSKSLNCFANGKATETPQWLDAQPGWVSITPREPLVPGRNRYNCTARHQTENRWFWYSHPFIRRHRDGSWYAE